MKCKLPSKGLPNIIVILRHLTQQSYLTSYLWWTHQQSDGNLDYCSYRKPWFSTNDTCDKSRSAITVDVYVDADVSMLCHCNLLSIINSLFSLTDMVVKCPSNAEFTFADFEFEENLVTHWNLVCDQKWQVPLHAFILVHGLSWLWGYVGVTVDSHH